MDEVDVAFARPSSIFVEAGEERAPEADIAVPQQTVVPVAETHVGDDSTPTDYSDVEEKDERTRRMRPPTTGKALRLRAPPSSRKPRVLRPRRSPRIVGGGQSLAVGSTRVRGRSWTVLLASESRKRRSDARHWSCSQPADS